MNTKFNDLSIVPLEENIRDKIGISIDISNISTVLERIKELDDNEDFLLKEIISQRNQYLFNFKKSVQYVYDYLNG